MELDMFKADWRIIEVKEMKNAVEQYVYDNRAYLDTYGDRAKYVDEATKDKFLGQLNAVEEWLYNDGQNVSKEDYEAKLNELKIIGQ